MALWLAASLTVTGLLGAGCGGSDARSSAHAERADELLAEGRSGEALIELRSALQLEPEDAALNVRVGDLSRELGFVADAVDFYREAHELVPEDTEVTLKLAALLVHLEPDSVQPLIDDVLKRDPNSVSARVVLVEAAIAWENLALARRTAEEARRIDPDHPDVWWSKARAGEAQIKATKRSKVNRVQTPAKFEQVLEDYSVYMQLGGERKLGALLAKADVLAGWPGHVRRAAIAYRRALEYAKKNGSRAERILASERTMRFGRTVGRDGLVLLAGRQLVEIAPDYLPGWTHLIEAYEKEPLQQRRVWGNMLHSQASNPSAHILYAQHLANIRNLASGTQYLRDQVEAGVDEAALLTGIANLQLTHGFPSDAASTIDALEQKHPGRSETQLVLARLQLVTNRADEAVSTLQPLVAEHESVELQVLRARAGLRSGDLALAQQAIARASVLSIKQSTELRRLKARIHFEAGEYQQTVAILKWLQPREGLSPRERKMLAISYYETGFLPVGRKLLEELIERDEGAPEAVLELTRRDGNNLALKAKVRRYLELTHQRHPSEIEVLRVLTQMDIEEGAYEQAMIRLHRAVGRSPKSVDIYILRGQLELAAGDYKAARDDAERVLLLDPTRANEAMELLAAVYALSPNPDKTLESMRRVDSEKKLSPDRLAVMAYLMLRLGDPEGARESYERALAGGSELRLLKSDLAFLLAYEGADLNRAEQLAFEAANAPGESLSAVDTLGYVYLRNGKADAALWQFRFAADHADPPVASYFYHLGLALMELDRSDEARNAFERALAIDPEFPDAGEARRRLGLLSAGAAVENEALAETS